MHEILLRGNPIGIAKGVLFDKDGTLTNSEKELSFLAKERIRKTIYLLKSMDKNNIKTQEVERLLMKAYGVRNGKIHPDGMIAIASREHNIISTATIINLFGLNWPEAIDLTRNIFLQVDNLNEKFLNKRPLIRGAREALLTLKEAGIKCALISNDTDKGIQNFINENKLSKIFSSIRSAEKYPTKPNPRSAIELCESIKLNPSECALIGDSETDLKMALQANFGLILGFTGGWSRHLDLSMDYHLFNEWKELGIKQTPKIVH